MILWSAFSMSQFEISSWVIMFSMLISIESLYVITKCFWNIDVSTNFSAKYTCRSFLSSLFDKKLLLKSLGIFVSLLKCFLESTPLLHRIFCFKLFLKYWSAVTSHLKQLELLFRILFLSESENSRNVGFSLIVWLFVKGDKFMIIAEPLLLESVALS